MLHCVARNGKWGYIDSNGRTVVKARSDACLPFSDGLGGVFNGSRLEIISEQGEVVGICDNLLADHFSPGFSGGLLCVYDNSSRLAGYIDASGSWVVQPRFLRGSKFHEGVAVATDESSALCGLIGNSGEWLKEPEFDEILDFGDGMTTTIARTTTQDSPCILIDINACRVSEIQFEDGHQGQEGLHPVKQQDGWGVVDETGERVVPFIFGELNFFSDGLAAAESTEGGVGAIDRFGSWHIDPIFHWLGSFSEGLCVASVEDSFGMERWGYVDRRGQWAIGPRFEEAYDFQDGIAQVSQDSTQDGLDYINRSGRLIWQH